MRSEQYSRRDDRTDRFFRGRAGHLGSFRICVANLVGLGCCRYSGDCAVLNPAIWPLSSSAGLARTVRAYGLECRLDFYVSSCLWSAFGFAQPRPPDTGIHLYSFPDLGGFSFLPTRSCGTHTDTFRNGDLGHIEWLRHLSHGGLEFVVVECGCLYRCDWHHDDDGGGDGCGAKDDRDEFVGDTMPVARRS